jgi:hypothetical protein
MLAVIIPAVVYAGLVAFGYRIATPSGFSRVTLSFLVLLVAAFIQAILAGRGSPWPKALNWFMGLCLAYWLWGVALYTFGYETALTRVLFADNLHPATWGLPAVLLLVWWLRPSGLIVRRGIDIALVTLLAILFLRIAFDFVIPDSQDLFSWKVGFGWIGLPFEGPQPRIQDTYGQTWFAAYHWDVYGVSIRPSFIFEHANTFGFISAFGFVFGLTQRSRIGVSFALIFGILLISSTSNTSVVAASAGTGVFLIAWVWNRTRYRSQKVLVSLAVAALFAVTFWRVSFDSFNFSGRRGLWESALSTMDLPVLTGLGGATWESTITTGSFVGSELHNSWLSVLAWGGLVGLILMIALWFLGAVLALRAVKASNLASLALLTTCLVLSMTESTFAYRYWSMGNALLLAAVLLTLWRPSETRALPTEPGAQTVVPPSEPLQTRQPK